MKSRSWMPLTLLSLLVMAPCSVTPSFGQTVRPVIVEYSDSARGKFELVNNSLRPVAVVVEAKSFTINEAGEGAYVPLASDIHLKLSAMSLHIPPRQSRYVFYEAAADHLPAWFVIYSTFSSPRREPGINVRLGLPHTVYLLQKEPLQKTDVSIESARYVPAEHRLLVTLENGSSRLGRVLDWQADAGKVKQSGSGFPLLPHNRRRLDMPWSSPDIPQELSLRFEHFTLKQKLQADGNLQ